MPDSLKESVNIVIPDLIDIKNVIAGPKYSPNYMENYKLLWKR
jgi:hypothetical protein